MPAQLKPAAFLDRDGVINSYVDTPEFGTVDSPSHPDQFELRPGAAKAIAMLNRLGLPVIVVSNQPGIAKRKFSAELLQAMTEKMRAEIEAAGGRLDAVYYCLHHPQAALADIAASARAGSRSPDCCSKRPGILESISGRLYMIGGAITDIAAGSRAATRTIVSSRKCYLCEELERRQLRPDFVVDSLARAAELVRALEQGDRAGDGVACTPEELAGRRPADGRFLQLPAIRQSELAEML